MVELVAELAVVVGVAAACAALEVPRSWYYRRQAAPATARAEAGQRRPPANALSQAERAEVRGVLNSERFCDQAPREVYATLLDEGRYLCHWRTMYRILAAHGEVGDRRGQRRHVPYAKPELVARRPNEVWSWDITWLPGRGRGTFYYLYEIIDIHSRFVAGWMVAPAESGWWARELVKETCAKQGIAAGQLTLHADRGSPMKAKTLAELLASLQVHKSHGRPHTPNDNPFSEAQFKTLKYADTYPDTFADIEAARAWARAFFTWYNHEHHHVGLGLLTPAVVHYGHADEVLAHRQALLDQAYARHPERFVKGAPRVPALAEEVWINPPPQPAPPTPPLLPLPEQLLWPVAMAELPPLVSIELSQIP